MIRVAVEGCGHGTLHAIYASIRKTCEVNAWKGVDLLIIGGDFQAVRNSHDLNTMSVPQKFRAIGDFHEYYSGARLAPCLTLFVGGNHEASSHLQELYYGGWVAPNIYYLGAANVLRFGDLRVAGLSGIWKGYNYNKPHFEKLPYTADEIKSLYHVREIDVRKLLLVRSQVDVGVSHDWPRAIEWQGDYKALFRKKDLFEEDAKAGRLGSLAAKLVMDRLRPPHWFAAHLHCKFSATVKYDDDLGVGPIASTLSNRLHREGISCEELNSTRDPTPNKAKSALAVKNNDEIDLDMDDDSTMNSATHNKEQDFVSSPALKITNSSAIPEDVRSQLPAAFSRPAATDKGSTSLTPPPAEISNVVTNFLALDKCLPNRKFLQILEIEPLSASNHPAPLKLSYDPEWLAILRAFRSHDPHQHSPPNLGEAAYMPLVAIEKLWVGENLVTTQKLQVPENFEITAPAYDGADIRNIGREQTREYTNPQTRAFCELLDIPNYFDASDEQREKRRLQKTAEIEAEARSASGGRCGSRGGRGFGEIRRGGGGRGRSQGKRHRIPLHF